MLESVLRYLNNYFINDYCDATACLADGVTVDHPEKFVANQYIKIDGTKLNDGVYKILSISGHKLVVSSLIAETSDFCVWGLAIPKTVLDIVTEITAYNSDNSGNIKSETLGDYSVTFDTTDSSWVGAFKSRLASYRKVFLIKPERPVRII